MGMDAAGVCVRVPSALRMLKGSWGWRGGGPAETLDGVGRVWRCRQKPTVPRPGLAGRIQKLGPVYGRSHFCWGWAD